jgi:hypothetical protein
MRVSERAAQIWPMLALAARNRQILSYGLLGKLISVPPSGLGQLLEPIQSYCLLHGLPPLSALVVSKESGLPGAGFIAAADLPREQMRVFEHDWLTTGCPSPEAFAAAVTRLPSNGIPRAIDGGQAPSMKDP